MSDLASQLPPVDEPMRRPEPNLGYPSFGMPEDIGFLWHLRCTWLQNTLDALFDDTYFAYFAQHALGLAKAWFSKLVAIGADKRRFTTGHHLWDPSPFFDMFGEIYNPPLPLLYIHVCYASYIDSQARP